MIVPGYQRLWDWKAINLIIGNSATNAFLDLEPAWQLVAEAKVDAGTMYTVTCRKHVSIWLREYGIEREDWYEHIDPPRDIYNVFDITAEMMMMLKLTWGNE